MALNEDMMPTFPSDKIKCKDCEFKKSGVIGFKNKFCLKFPLGKSDEILFDNADCPLYRKQKTHS